MLENKPLVSIILTTYNRQHFIIRAIKNLLSQTYENIEIIIVNDNSTDNTDNIIKDFILKYNSFSIIKYFKNNKNLGLSGSRNIGIKNSNGEYITFMDDDDLILPDKIEIQINKILETNKKICYCGTFWIENNQVLKQGLSLNKNVSFENGYLVSALFHRSVFQEIGLFDPFFIESSEDTDFLIRVNKKYDFCFVFDNLYLHYYYDNHMSSNAKKSIAGFEKILTKHKNFLNKYELSSLYLKLAIYYIFDNKKKISYIIKSILSKISVKNIIFFFIFLLPFKIAKFFINKILDIYNYPKSFNGRYIN